MSARKKTKRKTMTNKEVYEELRKPRRHHAVLSCAKNGYMSLMWSKTNDDQDLIETVWGFAANHWRMKKLKIESETKIAIVVVRSDGKVSAFDRNGIPNSKAATKTMLALLGLLN